ncbi:MAG TPA: DUF86 domain-containing protein [Chlamydiales bacterium]|nr:DUF86 domain-containing protein [Chlamydiales bacterium]
MSSREWTFRVQDILEAIEKVSRYVENMTLTQFKENELVMDAVIRNFEIIGEASKNIPLSIRRSYPEVPWNEMSGMRNVLIHEYFGVDVGTVWHTTKKNLPKLQKQLRAILKEVKASK